LFETNCTINNHNDTVTICFENDNCKINAKYDQNLNLISTSREDKNIFWLSALFISLLVGISVYCIGAFLLWFIIGFFCISKKIPLPY